MLVNNPRPQQAQHYPPLARVTISTRAVNDPSQSFTVPVRISCLLTVLKLFSKVSLIHRFLIVKALFGALSKEKALVGFFRAWYNFAKVRLQLQ